MSGLQHSEPLFMIFRNNIFVTFICRQFIEIKQKYIMDWPSVSARRCIYNHKNLCYLSFLSSDVLHMLPWRAKYL